MFDRIKTNLKLSLESGMVIAAEVVKLISYWAILWKDTKVIYSFFKLKLTVLKKMIWG